MFRDIPKSFYGRPATVVARELIGCRLLVDHPSVGAVGGVVVETEAYASGDPACHAWHLEKKRNKDPMAIGKGHELFGPPGLTYIYLNYGMYWLLNVVTDPEGTPGGVLIRAVEPSLGENIFWENRPKIKKREDLANGPGKLTVAMGIDDRHHQMDVTTGPIRFEKPTRHKSDLEISTSSRVGISQGVDLPWRFFAKGSIYVSRGIPAR